MGKATRTPSDPAPLSTPGSPSATQPRLGPPSVRKRRKAEMKGFRFVIEKGSVYDVWMSKSAAPSSVWLAPDLRSRNPVESQGAQPALPFRFGIQ